MKRPLEIEDTANRFLQGAGDGAQSGFKMALFKRTDKTYLVGFSTAGEGGEAYYFLEYKNGKWRDISKQVVPEYSDRKIYELPRRGTTVEVFETINNEAELRIGKREQNCTIWNGRMTNFRLKSDAFKISLIPGAPRKIAALPALNKFRAARAAFDSSVPCRSSLAVKTICRDEFCGVIDKRKSHNFCSPEDKI